MSAWYNVTIVDALQYTYNTRYHTAYIHGKLRITDVDNPLGGDAASGSDVPHLNLVVRFF